MLGRVPWPALRAICAWNRRVAGCYAQMAGRWEGSGTGGRAGWTEDRSRGPRRPRSACTMGAGENQAEEAPGSLAVQPGASCASVDNAGLGGPCGGLKARHRSWHFDQCQRGFKMQEWARCAPYRGFPTTGATEGGRCRERRKRPRTAGRKPRRDGAESHLSWVLTTLKLPAAGGSREPLPHGQVAPCREPG